MAISDPNINLAPSFEQVQQALNKRADIAAQSGGNNGLDLLNAIASPLAQQAQVQQKQQADLRKNYQDNILEIARANNQLQIPEGATLQDVASGNVSPTLTPKKKIITQADVNDAVKSFGMDEAHSHIFDDMVGKEFDQKAFQDELIKKANFMHSSEKGNTEPSAFEYKDPSSGQWEQAQGYYDKDKKKYFLNNGQEAPGVTRPIQKSELGLSEKQQQYDEKMLRDAEKRFDSTQKRAGSFADAAKRLSGIGRLDALFKGYDNNLNPQEWEEAALSWAGILGSGTGVNSRAQVEALVPKTLVGNMRAQLQWYMNNPTGTNQQEFAKRIQQGMEREKQFNENYLKDSISKGISGYQNTFMRKPDDSREMLQKYNVSWMDIKNDYPRLAKKLYPENYDDNGKEIKFQTFNTIGQAEKANLPPGTRIIIGRKFATVQ